MHLSRLRLLRPGVLPIAAAALVATLTIPLRPTAQTAAPKADAEFLRKAYDTYTSMRQTSPYRSTSWSYLGPTNISGRSTDTAVADRNGRRRIFVAYATSGVWRTDDSGTTWQAVFE